MSEGGSDFVGRDAELEVLTTALAEAVAGRSRLVLCTAEAGVGKTRLLMELAQVAERDAIPVRWARSLELPDAPPYWLWRQVIGDDGPKSTDRIVYFEWIVDWLAELAGPAGAVLVIDDIHWADEPSLVALRHVVRSVRTRRLLICAAERSGSDTVSAGWTVAKSQLLAEAAVETVPLSGLSPGETDRYLRSVLGRAPAAAQSRQVYALTSGNPFYIRELGRAARALSPEQPVTLPARLVDVINDRIATLPARAQEFLRGASILGEEFAVAVAARLVNRSVVECLDVLDAAMAAGFVMAGTTAGHVRFQHGLVRSALAAGFPLPQRVLVHRCAAEAIEELYRDTIEPHQSELARHWAEVSVGGERGPGVVWSRRAADFAMAQLAFEDAERLYRQAVDCGGTALALADRVHLVLGATAAAVRAGRPEAARQGCVEAMDLARKTGDALLLAEAASALDAIGIEEWDRDVDARCSEALAQVPADSLSLRAKLLAQRAQAQMYCGDYASALTLSAEALADAESSKDSMALVAALKARQLTCSGMAHLAERTELAARMIGIAEELRLPEVEMWGRLWAIDAHFQRGRLARVEQELARLSRCAERVGGPMPRWHLLKTRAALAQVRGEFDDAERMAGQAKEVLAPRRQPALGAYLVLLSAVGHHRGHRDIPAALQPAEDRSDTRDQLVGVLMPAQVMAECGRIAEARQWYRQLGPPATWKIPPYFDVVAVGAAAVVAVAVGADDDIRYLHGRLSSWRGRYLASGAGAACCLGPVELVLGKCAAALGLWDEAEADLVAAVTICADTGAVAYRIEAECERAYVAAHRGDMTAAQRICEQTLPEARRLGMVPWVKKLEGIQAAGQGSGDLSPREREVAGLVAEGLSNRDIARRLVISERTAQNHVQHILTKLGFSSRSQIAVWAARDTV